PQNGPLGSGLLKSGGTPTYAYDASKASTATSFATMPCSLGLTTPTSKTGIALATGPPHVWKAARPTRSNISYATTEAYRTPTRHGPSTGSSTASPNTHPTPGNWPKNTSTAATRHWYPYQPTN